MRGIDFAMQAKRDANGVAGFSLHKDVFAGALSGCVTKTAVAPLERAKILLQMQAMSLEPGKYRGIWHALRSVYATEGLRGLWKGNGANVARVVPVYGLKFGLNDHFKAWIMPVAEGSSPPFGKLLLAGVLAGLVQQCATLPLEVARTRLTMGAALKPPMIYRGITDCFRRMVVSEGWTSLYKGFTATILSGVPFVALQLTFFGVSVSGSGGVGWVRFSAHPPPTAPRPRQVLKAEIPKGSDGKPSLLWMMPAGMVASILAQLIAYPGDTVRKLMIVNGAAGQTRAYRNTWVRV